MPVHVTIPENPQVSHEKGDHIEADGGYLYVRGARSSDAGGRALIAIYAPGHWASAESTGVSGG